MADYIKNINDSSVAENTNEIFNNYADNIEELYNDFIKSLSNIPDLLKNNPSKIKKNNNIEESDSHIELDEESEEKSLCKIIDDIAAWTEWSISLTEEVIKLPEKLAEFIANVLGESISVITDLVNKGLDALIKWINDKLEEIINKANQKIKEKQENIKNKNKSKLERKIKKIQKFIKKIIKYIKLLILKIKKAILDAQLWVYKNAKKILETLANGRCVAALNTILAGVLTALQTCSAAIAAGLQAINAILQSLIATFMAIKAKNMAFFMTPKILITGKLLAEMAPVEPANDLSGFISKSIIDPVIEAYINGIKNANNVIKQTYISTKIAEYLASSQISDGSPTLQLLDPQELKNKIQGFIDTLLAGCSEPLPKYEKLSIINIRFLIWLTTVFEPTMKMSFGIPGMP